MQSREDEDEADRLYLSSKCRMTHILHSIGKGIQFVWKGRNPFSTQIAQCVNKQIQRYLQRKTQ
jgi:hypothetical protein